MTAKHDLIKRSNRLGADPKNTNYAGGNTSAKGTEKDPVTGKPVELLWVKGSGGDLGTLTEAGLAVLRLDRVRALVDVYPGVEREDEMVAAFDYCLHGTGGAAPSIDTAMHALVDSAHVDHLHPDSGIAFATAKDGAKLTAKAFGGQGALGAVAPPRLPARARHRGAEGEASGCGGLHPGRPRHHRVGLHERGGREELPLDHPDRGRIHRQERIEEPVRARRAEERRAEAGRAPGEGCRAGADDPRAGVARPPDGRPLHRRPGGARLPGVRRGAAPGRARHQLPRPLPAHQGQADAARSSCRCLGPRLDRAAEEAARGVSRRLHEVLREARRRRAAPPCAAPTP